MLRNQSKNTLPLCKHTYAHNKHTANSRKQRRAMIFTQGITNASHKDKQTVSNKQTQIQMGKQVHRQIYIFLNITYTQIRCRSFTINFHTKLMLGRVISLPRAYETFTNEHQDQCFSENLLRRHNGNKKWSQKFIHVHLMGKGG